MMNESYLEMLRQFNRIIESYASEYPEHNLSLRFKINYIDNSGTLSAVTHVVERGNSTNEQPTVVSSLPPRTRDEDVQTRIACSIALIENGNFEGAVRQAQDAVDVEPENTHCYIALWRALRASGMDDTAFETMLKALAIFEKQELPTRMDNVEFEIESREAFAQWLFLAGKREDAIQQTTAAMALAEQAGLTERLDWLSLQLETIQNISG
jgi:predicted Zn-dependent protease